MITQIDALADALEKRGFSIDLDGDGRRIELLDYSEAVVFIELIKPARDYWPQIWDGCAVLVEAEQPQKQKDVFDNVFHRLAIGGLIPSSPSAG